MNDRERSGFTKTGFTKAGFSCCGRFSFCGMGKGECYYKDKDQEAMENCLCYLKHHSENKQIHTNIESKEENEQREINCKDSKNELPDDLVQLSLF